MIHEKAKVFLIDDHPLVRNGLANLINQQSNLVVCGEAGSASDALKQLEAVEPHIAVVDIGLSDSSGLELIRAMKSRWPQLLTLALSMHDERFYAERALRAGARGYVMKVESPNRVIAAIRQVLEGKVAVSETISSMLSERFVGGRVQTTNSPIECLSNRELEVFGLLGQGRDTRSISENLHISMKTVQAYCARIKEKLGLANATELLREAIRWTESRAAR